MTIQTEESMLASTLPKFSYKQALASWFALPSGSVHQVGSASIEDLIAFLASSSVNMKQRQTRMNLLAMLEQDSSQDMRWWVLLEFKHFRCPLHLYPSQEEALQPMDNNVWTT